MRFPSQKIRQERPDIAKHLEEPSLSTWMGALDFLKGLTKRCPSGLNTRLSALNGEVFNGYFDWRLSVTKGKGRTIRSDFVRDELLTIRKMFQYAKKEKRCGDKAIPSWDFIVERATRGRTPLLQAYQQRRIRKLQR